MVDLDDHLGRIVSILQTPNAKAQRIGAAPRWYVPAGLFRGDGGRRGGSGL
jgi:hypothetical protein